MSYYFSKETDYTYIEAVEKIKEVLQTEGFGVLTEIDVKSTLKKQIDVDFKNYCILGACNPPFAHKALQIEEKIGIMLPCNVIVFENRAGKTEVAVVNPLVAMQSVENPALQEVAETITKKLQSALAAC